LRPGAAPGSIPAVDAVWAVIAVLAIFGVAILSVGQVLLRGPADSEVPRRGGVLLLVGGALLATAAVLAVAHGVAHAI
jgi:hypothetical protein